MEVVRISYGWIVEVGLRDFLSESVVLELFGGRFYVVDCLCDEFVFEGFPAAVLHLFVSPLAMLFDVSFILYGFSASV